MSEVNVDANIRGIENIHQALHELGFRPAEDSDDSDSDWVRANNTPVSKHEARFGLTRRVNLEEGMETLMGNVSIALSYMLVTGQKRGSNVERYLIRTDTPLGGVKFLSDWATLEHSAFLRDNRAMDIAFVGGQAPWAVMDIRDGKVDGLITGNFAKMFAAFCSATHIDLVKALIDHQVDLGIPELRSRVMAATNRAKSILAVRRKDFERRQAAFAAEHQAFLLSVNESLEYAAADEFGGGAEEPVFEYSLHYMDDLDRPAGRSGVQGTEINPGDQNLAGVIQKHRTAKKLGQLAWIWRTVNNTSEPYLIFNPTTSIWELV